MKLKIHIRNNNIKEIKREKKIKNIKYKKKKISIIK